ncbi:hypothetical protein EVAR_97227_1 [Eumeta japonica]|uniref:Uncharacterized protein n=1 Tax=Eumeta variegata TaxID=151549 RepID=A0A4C2A7H7_EUMVA|nr:hypothetical protein EVAR_97227_1 [Eumeta japonica]
MVSVVTLVRVHTCPEQQIGYVSVEALCGTRTHASKCPTRLNRNKAVYAGCRDIPLDITGDSGYALRPWLRIPIADVKVDMAEERYNKCFKSARRNSYLHIKEMDIETVAAAAIYLCSTFNYYLRCASQSSYKKEVENKKIEDSTSEGAPGSNIKIDYGDSLRSLHTCLNFKSIMNMCPLNDGLNDLVKAKCFVIKTGNVEENRLFLCSCMTYLVPEYSVLNSSSKLKWLFLRAAANTKTPMSALISLVVSFCVDSENYQVRSGDPPYSLQHELVLWQRAYCVLKPGLARS